MEMILGFLIALAIGLTGVGGGVITAPVLMLFLGLPATEAVGTSLLFIAVVKTAAVPVYLWRKQVNFRVLACMVAGGVPGVLAGSVILHQLNAAVHGGVVLTAVGVIVVISAALMLLRLASNRERRVPKNRCWLLAFLSGLIGVEVGFSSAGAGALGTLALFHFTLLTPVEVVGTDLAFGFVLALIGGGVHFAAGSFSAPLVLKLISGGLIGATLGAYLGGVFPKRALRLAMSVWLVWLGSQLCHRGIVALAAGS